MNTCTYWTLTLIICNIGILIINILLFVNLRQIRQQMLNVLIAMKNI